MGNERKGQVEKAIELYKNKKQNKMKVKDISIETGIAESTLYRIFRENGLRTQRREKKIDVNKLEEALYMFLNREELKLTVKDIVEKTGISKQTIYVEVKAQNLDYKLRNEGYPKEDLEKAVILYQRPIREGFTLSKIYHETGIPKSALYEEL
ncbi:helix-turn-helix domain-containing protein, partial [Bacillus cereus]